MRLGVYPDSGLALARQRALDHREAVADGRNPLLEKRRERIPAFREAAWKVYRAHLPGWKNSKWTTSR